MMPNNKATSVIGLRVDNLINERVAANPSNEPFCANVADLTRLFLEKYPARNNNKTVIKREVLRRLQQREIPYVETDPMAGKRRYWQISVCSCFLLNKYKFFAFVSSVTLLILDFSANVLETQSEAPNAAPSEQLAANNNAMNQKMQTMYKSNNEEKAKAQASSRPSKRARQSDPSSSTSDSLIGSWQPDVLPADKNIYSFADVGGNKAVIALLKQMIVLPLLHPEISSYLIGPPSCGFLFHGPPGY